MEAGPASESRTVTWLHRAPAAIALGAVVLYAFGIVSTVGKLRASDLDVSQTFGRIPLEAHLRNGVGLVVNPSFVGLLGLGCAMYLVLRFTEPGGLHRGPFARYPLLRIPIFVLLGVPIVLIPLTAPWPDAIFLVALAVVGLAAVWLSELMHRPIKERAAYFMVGIVTLILVSQVWAAYFRADPLPTARLSVQGGHLTGPLIASDGGVLYLGATEAKRLYLAVPSSEVDSFITTKTTRNEEPSLLDYLGDWL